jgi:acyl-CoA thioester hydrolase
VEQPGGVLLASGFSKHMWVTGDWKPARLERQLPELYRLLKDVYTAAFTKI